MNESQGKAPVYLLREKIIGSNRVLGSAKASIGLYLLYFVPSNKVTANIDIIWASLNYWL
jgi:hypothetical protein